MIPRLLLSLILSFLDALLPRVIDSSEGGAAFGVGFGARSSLVSLRTLAFFFPLVTYTFYSFNATKALSTLDHCSNFDSPILLFTIVFNFWQMGVDIFCWISISHNSNTVLSCTDSRILHLYRLSKTSSDGIFDIESRTSSHLVSNPLTLSLRRVMENKSA